MISTLDPETENFISKIQKKLDSISSPFLQPRHLYELGIFGSHSAASHFISEGGIPHIRISPYRVLIEKEALLNFLKDRYQPKSIKSLEE